MGTHAGADLAWGVDLSGEYGDDLHESITQDKDDLHSLGGEWLDRLFGWDEPQPWHPATPEWRAASREECDAVRTAYDARHYTAVPVDFAYTGSNDYTVWRLVLRRSHVDVYEPGEFYEVTPEHIREPDDAEREAVAKVLDALGFTGNRTLKLAVSTTYDG